MKHQLTISCESEKKALEKACEHFHCQQSDLQVQVIQPAKKGLFGKVKKMGEYQVFLAESEDEKGKQTERGVVDDQVVESRTQAAISYLQSVADAFDIGEIHVQAKKQEDFVLLDITGKNVGVLIGHRGETLDALQYLTCLVANRNRWESGDYVRFILNSGNFRDKRKQTLEALGKRMAEKALRRNKKVILDPMNPYERRIIHSSAAEVEGVYTKSIGREPDRKVIIYVEKERYDEAMKKGRSSKKKDQDFVSSQPSTYNFEKEFLKDGSSYGKIDLQDTNL